MTTLDRLPRVHSELNVDIREPFSDPLGSGARTNQRPCSACSVDRVHAVGDGAFARFSRERQHELAQFETIWETMDRVAPFVMALSLWELGFLRSRSQAISAGDIAARTCSPSRYKPLIAQWLRMLTREDLAQRVMGGRHDSVSAEIDIARAQREVSNAITALDITTRYPGFIEYFKTCVAHQTDLLRGRAIPQKLLFPGGNSRIVDGVYRDNPAAALQNSVLAAIVGAIAIDSFYGRPLRILEVGAGTGATTAAVAHAGAAFDHYCFTDISGFFIRRASRRFGERAPILFPNS